MKEESFFRTANSLMYWPFETSDCLDSPEVRVRRYGVIEARGGELKAVHFRPYPKFASRVEGWFDEASRGWRRREDRCWLYYNEPRSAPGYLALAYLKSGGGTSLASVQAALAALDEIARIKRSEAIVCEASNLRLSDRMLARYGFEKHAPRLGGRHFIKRFTHPARYEYLLRPLGDIFGDERSAVGEVFHA